MLKNVISIEHFLSLQITASDGTSICCFLACVNTTLGTAMKEFFVIIAVI